MCRCFDFDNPMFLSTPPSRVATAVEVEYQYYAAVSIHATLAGGDALNALCGIWEEMFLSTPPSRVATNHDYCSFSQYYVSIHATLAGGDVYRTERNYENLNVSIHATLAGGDSPNLPRIILEIVVSIHATLAGGDGQKRRLPVVSCRFLSTPPSRVATAKVYKNVQCLLRKREKIICKIKNNLKHPPHIPIATSKKCTACPKTSDGIGAKLLGKVCLLSPRTGAATQAAHHPEQIRGGGQGAPRGFCSGCQAGKSAGCRFRGQSARPARL